MNSNGAVKLYTEESQRRKTRNIIDDDKPRGGSGVGNTAKIVRERNSYGPRRAIHKRNGYDVMFTGGVKKEIDCAANDTAARTNRY